MDIVHVEYFHSSIGLERNYPSKDHVEYFHSSIGLERNYPSKDHVEYFHSLLADVESAYQPSFIPVSMFTGGSKSPMVLG